MLKNISVKEVLRLEIKFHLVIWQLSFCGASAFRRPLIVCSLETRTFRRSANAAQMVSAV